MCVYIYIYTYIRMDTPCSSRSSGGNRAGCADLQHSTQGWAGPVPYTYICIYIYIYIYI